LYGNYNAFFGRVTPSLVRHGDDFYIPNGEHTALNVFTEMFLQISVDYSVLPDARTLTIDEILFYYNGLRAGLKDATKPQN